MSIDLNLVTEHTLIWHVRCDFTCVFVQFKSIRHLQGVSCLKITKKLKNPKNLKLKYKYTLNTYFIVKISFSSEPRDEEALALNNDF